MAVDHLVVSTHLDDAVLSLGQFLQDHPGTVVLTVFTDAPPVERADGWNHATTDRPFAPDSQAVRRAEDADALATLRAEARWLGLHEAEYRPAGQDPTELATHLAATIEELRPRRVHAPLGLHHADHLAVGDACRRLMTDSTTDGPEWSIYLDLPYARTFPDEVDERLASARAAGLPLDELPPRPVFGPAKRVAVYRYATQVEAVRGEHPALDLAIREPERAWRVTAAPGGTDPGRDRPTVA